MFEIRLVTRQRNWHDVTKEVNSVLCVSVVHREQLRTCHVCWCLQSSSSQRHFCLVLIHRQTRTCIDFFCNDKLNTAKKYLFLSTQAQLSVQANYPNDPLQGFWPMPASLSQPLFPLMRNYHGPGTVPDRQVELCFGAWECRGHLISVRAFLGVFKHHVAGKSSRNFCLCAKSHGQEHSRFTPAWRKLLVDHLYPTSFKMLLVWCACVDINCEVTQQPFHFQSSYRRRILLRCP